MIQIHWQLHWQNSIWYAMAAELTRLGSRKDDRVAVHAAQHTFELMEPLFDYQHLSPKRIILLLERLATQSEWRPLPIPAENEIGAIIAEDLIDVTFGRRLNYHLAPKLQRLFTAIHEAVPTLADELVVYADVLRRRWGQENLDLLDEICQRIPLDWQLDEVTVFPVFPVSGGSKPILTVTIGCADWKDCRFHENGGSNDSRPRRTMIETRPDARPRRQAKTVRDRNRPSGPYQRVPWAPL